MPTPYVLCFLRPLISSLIFLFHRIERNPFSPRTPLYNVFETEKKNVHRWTHFTRHYAGFALRNSVQGVQAHSVRCIASKSLAPTLSLERFRGGGVVTGIFPPHVGAREKRVMTNSDLVLARNACLRKVKARRVFTNPESLFFFFCISHFYTALLTLPLSVAAVAFGDCAVFSDHSHVSMRFDAFRLSWSILAGLNNSFWRRDTMAVRCFVQFLPQPTREEKEQSTCWFVLFIYTFRYHFTVSCTYL